MTALQLVNKVIYEKLGLSDNVTTLANPTATVAKILWALNEIQRRLTDFHDFKKLRKQGTINLATGTTLYSLADDFARFIKGDDALYYTKVNTGTDEIDKITVVNDEDFKNHNASETITEGKPYVARLFGMDDATGNSQIEVYGEPTADYDGIALYYEYIRYKPDLAANDDLSPFSDHLMIEGAYLQIRVSDGDADQQDLTDFLTSAANAAFNNDSGRKRTLKYRDF